MRAPRMAALAVIVTLASACTEEATTPIDLDTTTTVSSPVTRAPELPDDDPNAEARQQVIDLAKEECRKDPTREFGVVIIADADGNEVNRYEHPCRDLDDEGPASDASGEE